MHKFLRIGLLISVWLTTPQVWAQSLQIYGLQYLVPTTPNNTDFELVQIDPLTASTTSLYTIAETKTVESASSTFDHDTQSYLFWGTDDEGSKRFYRAATDTPLWKDSAVNGLRPLEVQHDLQSNRTYGLIEDEHSGGLSLVELDQHGGSYTLIAELPEIRFVEIGSSTFDSNHHRYFFLGIDASDFSKRLYALDVASGTLLSASNPLSASRHLRCLQYNLNTDQLLGLYAIPDPDTPQDPVTMRFFYHTYLAEIDSLTGAATLINATPVLSGYEASVVVGSSDFDQFSEILVSSVIDEAGVRRLLLIQASDGSLLANAAFGQSVFEIACDNHNYAQQAYDGSTSRGIAQQPSLALGPNPTTDFVSIRLPNVGAEGVVQLLDRQGRSQGQWHLTAHQRELRLSMGELPAGVYLLRVQRGHEPPLTSRVIKR